LISIHAAPSEDKQKKKKQGKEKSAGEREGSKTLQRSKTFVSLLFKRDARRDMSGNRRERDTSRDSRETGTGDSHRGRFKSPSHHADKGERTKIHWHNFIERHILHSLGQPHKHMHVSNQTHKSTCPSISDWRPSHAHIPVQH
jgi:hypothetical protein